MFQKKQHKSYCRLMRYLWMFSIVGQRSRGLSKSHCFWRLTSHSRDVGRGIPAEFPVVETSLSLWASPVRGDIGSQLAPLQGLDELRLRLPDPQDVAYTSSVLSNTHVHVRGWAGIHVQDIADAARSVETVKFAGHRWRGESNTDVQIPTCPGRWNNTPLL